MEQQQARTEPALGVDSDELKAAQARWELHLAILHEEERRLVRALEAIAHDASAVPNLDLDRLAAARTQCNDAFESLTQAIARRAAALRGSAGAADSERA